MLEAIVLILRVIDETISIAFTKLLSISSRQYVIRSSTELILELVWIRGANTGDRKPEWKEVIAATENPMSQFDSTQLWSSTSMQRILEQRFLLPPFS